MVPLFKTLTRPVLQYGNVWRPNLKKHVLLVENVQRRFTKRIIGMKHFDYEDRLNSLNLPSLEFRRTRGDTIETYKIIHGLYDLSCTSSLFTLNLSAGTRGHCYKLIKPTVSTNIYSHFFTNRLIKNWNNLPCNSRNAKYI